MTVTSPRGRRLRHSDGPSPFRLTPAVLREKSPYEYPHSFTSGRFHRDNRRYFSNLCTIADSGVEYPFHIRYYTACLCPRDNRGLSKSGRDDEANDGDVEA